MSKPPNRTPYIPVIARLVISLKLWDFLVVRKSQVSTDKVIINTVNKNTDMIISEIPIKFKLSFIP